METAQTANPPTPDSVWAMLQELTASQKELSESQKETDKQIKEINKRHGDFTNKFGEIVEYMVAPNLQDRFYDLGLDFQEVYNDVKMKDKKNDISLQIDVYLQNSDTGMLVEVKADLTISDINAHIQRMEKMRRYADLRGNNRVFMGAVAGVIVKKDVRDYALDKGFYLVEPSGQTFNITPPNNKPKAL